MKDRHRHFWLDNLQLFEAQEQFLQPLLVEHDECVVALHLGSLVFSEFEVGRNERLEKTTPVLSNLSALQPGPLK